MMGRSRNRCARSSGFFLVEMALAILILGLIAGTFYPLLEMTWRNESARSDGESMQQSRNALAAYAVRNGGLPAPLKLMEDGAGVISRIATLDETTTVSASVSPYGALPVSLLASRPRSSLGTLFRYDVHPALRADKAFVFSELVSKDGTDEAMISASLSELHAPNRDTQGTGGAASQLCRNLNTLIEMERLLAADPAAITDTLRAVVSPRVRQPGIEDRFQWTATPGGGLFEPTPGAAATVTAGWLHARSTPAAFVVTRPHPSAFARLDRGNAVFRGDVDGQSSARIYRVYEAPSAGASDSPTDDLRDYGGYSASTSLLELRSMLQGAGQCTKPAEACMNTEIAINFNNAIFGRRYLNDVADAAKIALDLRWIVADASFTPVATGALPSGLDQATVAAGGNATACVPVVLRNASALSGSMGGAGSRPLSLTVYAVLPDQTYVPVILARPMMSHSGANAVIDRLGLDSGQSHAATVKCYSRDALRFNDSGSGPLSAPNPTTDVTCSVTAQ